MERLTNRDKKPISLTPQNGIRWMAIYRKLKQYEDAEENGLLVRLPCRVGDTVYIIIPPVSSPPLKGWVYEGKIYDVCTEGFFAGEYYNLEDDYTEYNAIGKTVFFTKAEAEAKLKEMEGENADSD